MANEDEYNSSEPESISQDDQASSVSVSSADELRALTSVVEALQRIPDDDVRHRVLVAAAAFFRLSLSDSNTEPPPRSTQSSRTWRTQPGPSFSEDRTISAKEFLIQKQPRTDVERVACLAYYLTHYRDTNYFKTIDVSKLNTEAAQPKFSNAAKAVDNATNSHYLVQGPKGSKQLSAPGELFVQALPDRDAARAAMANAKPRKRKKSGNQQNSTAEDNSGDE